MSSFSSHNKPELWGIHPKKKRKTAQEVGKKRKDLLIMIPFGAKLSLYGSRIAQISTQI